MGVLSVVNLHDVWGELDVAEIVDDGHSNPQSGLGDGAWRSRRLPPRR
jgi:hypothetical protein